MIFFLASPTLDIGVSLLGIVDYIVNYTFKNTNNPHSGLRLVKYVLSMETDYVENHE
jgi:hypothetical protein